LLQIIIMAANLPESPGKSETTMGAQVRNLLIVLAAIARLQLFNFQPQINIVAANNGF
jgi:hypothetical protein